jgi:V8-like Glu-specific endopeptidase
MMSMAANKRGESHQARPGMWVGTLACMVACARCGEPVWEPTSTTESAVVGGQAVPAGEWQTVGWLDVGCTGVMVSGDAVLYAAHCGVPTRIDFAGTVSYGEKGAGEPIGECTAHPNAAIGSGHDLAWCYLAHERPVPIDPMWSPERDAALKLSQDLLIVGYGQLNDRGKEFRKRAAWAPLVGVGAELLIGNENVGTCPGDSGGPAFMETDEGLSLVGILSSGQPGSCGVGWYSTIEQNRDWLAQIDDKSPRHGCSMVTGPGPFPGGGAGVLVIAAMCLWLRRMHGNPPANGAWRRGSKTPRIAGRWQSRPYRLTAFDGRLTRLARSSTSNSARVSASGASRRAKGWSLSGSIAGDESSVTANSHYRSSLRWRIRITVRQAKPG